MCFTVMNSLQYFQFYKISTYFCSIIKVYNRIKFNTRSDVYFYFNYYWQFQGVIRNENLCLLYSYIHVSLDHLSVVDMNNVQTSISREVSASMDSFAYNLLEL